MYVYLYDNFLRKKKHESIVKSIEVRLTDYGIAGKILRLNNYIDVKPIVEDEIKKGAKTIVIVGNDATFGQVLSRSATCNCLFGFIPIGEKNTISNVLGIPLGVDACDVLSKRRKERLDVGWMNNRYFISQLIIKPARIEVVYDEKFKVCSADKLEVVVCNLQPYYWKRFVQDKEKQVVNPQDGKLEAFLRPMTKKKWWGYNYEDPSVFPFEEMEIFGQEAFTVEADGKISKERKLKIKLARNKVEMVVGRNRQF